MSAQHRQLQLKVPSYQLSTVFAEGGKERKGDRKVGGVYSIGNNWEGAYDTLLAFSIFSERRFDHVFMYVHTWVCSYLCLCGYVTLSAVCV